MSRALVFSMLLTIGCGDSDDTGSGGAGGSAQIICPEVTPGQDEILVPEDRDRMIELCGPTCLPFVGQVFRDSDACTNNIVVATGSSLCSPSWTADCEAVDLRLELVGCVPLPRDISVFTGFAECWVHVEDGTIVTIGSTFWPLGEEVWRPCSAADNEAIFCDG